MATIKAYTDLSQSKTLSKILPLESADGGWYGTDNPLAANTEYWLYTKYTEKAAIPAWSLVALLDVLPKYIPHKDSKIIQEKENWCYNWRINDKCLYYACNIIKENNCVNIDYFICCYYTENVIDACYEMILKLHELKML